MIWVCVLPDYVNGEVKGAHVSKGNGVAIVETLAVFAVAVFFSVAAPPPWRAAVILGIVWIALYADTAVAFVDWIAFAETGHRITTQLLTNVFVVFDKGALGAAAEVLTP